MPKTVPRCIPFLHPSLLLPSMSSVVVTCISSQCDDAPSIILFLFSPSLPLCLPTGNRRSLRHWAKERDVGGVCHRNSLMIITISQEVSETWSLSVFANPETQTESLGYLNYLYPRCDRLIAGCQVSHGGRLLFLPLISRSTLSDQKLYYYRHFQNVPVPAPSIHPLILLPCLLLFPPPLLPFFVNLLVVY